MPTDDLDLPACLARIRAGDEDAARSIVEFFYPKIIRIVRSHLPRRMAEEDLAQEVFLKMFTRLDQYEARDGKPFEHWLARLTVRTCLDALRAERRRPEWRFSDLTALPDGPREWLDFLVAPDPHDAPTDALAARDLVGHLLDSLSPEDRLVLTMLDLEQRPVAEIAELTGWSKSLVKVRAFRARRKLRQRLESLETITQ